MEEKILCAAIWFKDIHPRAYSRPINTPGGVVLCGYRHVHVIAQFWAMTGKKMSEAGETVQGFLTNKNRFLNREEAGKMFIKNGDKLNYDEIKLFSEDLY